MIFSFFLITNNIRDAKVLVRIFAGICKWPWCFAIYWYKYERKQGLKYCKVHIKTSIFKGPPLTNIHCTLRSFVFVLKSLLLSKNTPNWKKAKKRVHYLAIKTRMEKDWSSSTHSHIQWWGVIFKYENCSLVHNASRVNLGL